MALVIVLMGVSGCGKSTVGRALAERLGCPFFDGDDFHPPENVAKMATGTPLDDSDREPWLARLHDLIQDHLARGQVAVLACSALKKRYRRQLSADNQGVRFIYLHGSYELIWARMQERSGHYMKADMLQSQFDALEIPDPQEAIAIDAAEDVDRIVDRILEQLDDSKHKALFTHKKPGPSDMGMSRNGSV